MKTKIRISLLAMLLAAASSCSRPATDYTNSLLQQSLSLLNALISFRASQTTETGRAVVEAHLALTKNLNAITFHCAADMKKMAPAEFEKYAKDADAGFSSLQGQILEQLKAIRSEIPADKKSPTWSPSPNIGIGAPVYEISEGHFYFCNWTTRYDMEKFYSSFELKKHLSSFREQVQ
jgi:hypothetical protein